jgi:protein involved in polysaccharide export with SLBB domain
MRSQVSRLLAAALAASLGATSLPSFAQIVPGISGGGAAAGALGDTGAGNTMVPQGGMGYGGNAPLPGLPTTPSITNSTLDPSGLQRQMDPQQRNAGKARPVLLPPLEDNEFQRFVFNATGQRLPLFGQKYFEQPAPPVAAASNTNGQPNGTDPASAPSVQLTGPADRTFAPADRVPVPADYVLGPGDEIYIRAWGSIDVDYRATVDRNGQINIPKVGTIGVAGLKANEVEGHIREQVGRVFKNFSLNVSLGQLRSVQVFVVGQARNPGTYTVSSLATLVNVVFASGGPGSNGSMRRVQLKRGGKVVTELDLYDFLISGSKADDQRLLPGDVIVYTPAGPRVALLGALDTPAIYELKAEGENIIAVLNYGGGTRASTNLKTAQLERIDSSQPKAPRTVTTLDLANASGTPLRDGDVVTLFAVAPQFANAITLRGNVASPLRYPYTPGMRVSQLIPDRDALITPDYYVRKNKLVQFAEAGASDVSTQVFTRDVKNIIDEPNWEYAAIERLDRQTLTMQLIPFNLGKAVIDKDPANDLELYPGDVVTIFAKSDIRNPLNKQTRLVRIEGEVVAPGIYQVAPGESLQRLIAKAGGLTPQAYLYGTEFSREETRKKQQAALDDAISRLEVSLASANATQAANLSNTNAQTANQLDQAQSQAARLQLARLKSLKSNGRISLELDPGVTNASALPDLRLEDGDRVLIPYRPAYVFAVGAVNNNNALLWREGRKLREYIDVAGLDADADDENMFLVRADGTVIHTRRSGWFKSFEGTVLMPGDTLVVPTRTNRETFWTGFVRGLKDWSQILYQFGLTAAAIQTLKQ